MSYLAETIEDLRLAHLKQAENPFESGNMRESAIAKGLRAIAEHHGKTLQEPVQWDANGEFKFTLVNDTYGEGIANLLNTISVRTGVVAHKGYVMSNGSWCRINHFDAEQLILNAHQAQ
ncbi:hypothetical protein [Aeromonas sp. MrichA-1]|uniref:hypothetical protein n=1 Tax=Aeromonas sp. MrichA-1 TaxID=2823362 RepID=UPI001B33001A|nr:hypothetical protein [Aeromonas sp. MrichA-1]MBP4081282.1 hypothetical protein [Aeromonas sp. MrichA-1]